VSYQDVSWEDVWSWLAFVVTILVVVMAIVGFSADHSVKSYFLESGGLPVTCVKAHREWATDTTAFCSDDYTKVLQVLKEANESLTKPKGGSR